MEQYNRIAIVSGFFPFPLFFGGAFDVYNRIVALKELGYTIDLICTCKTPPEQETIAHMKTLVEDIYIVKRKNRISDLFSIDPLQAVSRKELKEVQLDKSYPLVILESESVASILKNKYFKAGKVALRVHNNESRYFIQLANSTGNVLKKLYYYLDAFKFKRYSGKIFSKADRLWFISIDEMKEFGKNSKLADKSFYLPAPSGQMPVKQKPGGRNVLFVGSLFMPNNINAIEWYLNNVHAQVVKNYPDYTFVIAGSTGEVKEEDLAKMFSGYTNVRVHYNVPDLTALYADAALFINPMQYGTGVKLKSINGIINGLPLVSTHIGSEGIGLIDKEMFFKADKPEDFYNAISNIFTAKPQDIAHMVKKAQAFIGSNDYLTILKKETDGLFK